MNWEGWEAPEGWTLASLTDVADVVMGQSPPGRTYNTDKSGLPFFQGKAEFGDDHPTVRKWCTAPTRIAEPGDILMSVRAPVGPTNVADQRCAFGRGLAVIRPKPGVPTSLVRYAIKLQEDEIVSWGTGTTFTAINKQHFREIRIPLPPRGERDEIARLLDDAVVLQRTASAHLVAARRAIEKLRQGVLFSAYREAYELGVESRLEELLEEPMRNGYSARPTNAVTPFRILTLTATTTGWFDGSHFKYTAEEFDDDSPFWVRSGDIFVQRGNTAEYVGVPALYEGEGQQFLFPDLMIRLRVREDVGARFVWYMLLSPQLRNVVRSQATGSAGNMPKINQGILNDVLIPLPDAERRAHIVSQLDQEFAVASRLAEGISSAARRVERILPAVLGKAFRGELSGNGEVIGNNGMYSMGA